MITVRIYSLTNPIDNSIFYIGKTVGTLKCRLAAHIKDKEANYKKMKIIKDIISNGLLPIISELESILCNTEEQELEALMRERYWIDFYTNKGIILCSQSTKTRLLSAYQRESTKSKPTGIRFDVEKLNFVKERKGLKTNQAVVDFLLQDYCFNPNYIKSSLEEM